jgi:hypothetical protein
MALELCREDWVSFLFFVRLQIPLSLPLVLARRVQGVFTNYMRLNCRMAGENSCDGCS